jgi:hypothetical protein
MNIFILNAGRCGSTTWIEACRHIRNYSAAHESRAHLVGEARLDYPPRHIEADNRLSWFLGRLQRRYGNDAFYVHLQRERAPSVDSFVRRNEFGIMRAYRDGILLGADETLAPERIAEDYLDTVEQNLLAFLRDKPHRMNAHLETIVDDFQTFWRAIEAQGDLQAALAELDTRHNRSG